MRVPLREILLERVVLPSLPVLKDSRKAALLSTVGGLTDEECVGTLDHMIERFESKKNFRTLPG